MPYYDPQACARIASGTAVPGDEQKCREWGRLLVNIRQAFFVKFFPPIVSPPPAPPDPFWRLPGGLGDPDPEPNVFDHHIKDVLLGELLFDAIRRAPVGAASNPSIFTQLKESGAYKETIEGLHQQFTEATISLKQELDSLERECKESQ